MLSLKKLLERYARSYTTIRGGSDELQAAEPSPAPQPVVKKEEFQQDIEGLIRANTTVIAFISVIVLALFVSTLLLIQKYIANPTVVASLFVGFGALSMGLTTVIVNLFKIKTQSDVFRILSRTLDSASLQTIIDIMKRA